MSSETIHTEKNRNITGMVYAILGGILWGVSGACGQFLFQNKEVTARWLVPVRLFTAGFLLLCYFMIRDRKKAVSVWKNRKDAGDIVIYGLAGLMFCQFSYFQTIEWSNAGTATVIQYLGPALIVVYVCISTRRKPEWKEVISVILALSGIFLIATHGTPGTLVLSSRALIMGLLSAVSVVIYTVQPGRLLKRFDAPLILAWGMLAGGVALSAVFQPWRHMPVIDGETVRMLVYIILFGTMISFSLYLQSVKLIGSVKASLFACVEPVSATVLAAVWMKVSFAPIDLLGFVMIIATIFILAIPAKKQKD
ncbi:MAG TPA: EamA family transporter [Candidatus Choladousia intestinipullorum]|nr:EamA family transporter [Candidatus Choladousia intestinipullorum]